MEEEEGVRGKGRRGKGEVGGEEEERERERCWVLEEISCLMRFGYV